MPASRINTLKIDALHKPRTWQSLGACWTRKHPWLNRASSSTVPPGPQPPAWTGKAWASGAQLIISEQFGPRWNKKRSFQLPHQICRKYAAESSKYSAAEGRILRNGKCGPQGGSLFCKNAAGLVRRKSVASSSHIASGYHITWRPRHGRMTGQGELGGWQEGRLLGRTAKCLAGCLDGMTNQFGSCLAGIAR